MHRLFVTLLLLSMLIPSLVSPAVAQSVTDGEAAAITAVELSELEAIGDFNGLYDRIHPDAHAVIPRAAVIGWFQNEFAPLGPGVSTVTGVRFVEWTWPVTGQTYPYTAEVSFRQPFANGTVVEDVVRLVQDHNGEWRWFFGRSREFVDEQIAKYVPAVPVATQNQSILDAVIQDIDEYWAISFQASGRPYASPRVLDISSGGYSVCGYLNPNVSPAFYCSLDQTIFISIERFDYIDQLVGDFAWITILAHEWGHHVQALDGAYAGPGNAMELQADCLAGSYALDAETRGLLESGDVIEAVTISAMSGDAPWLPQDEAGAHGTSDDRVAAFMRGYLDGFIGCDFLGTMSTSTNTRVQREPSRQDLTTFLPLQYEVPSDLAHSGDRSRSLSDVAVNYTDPGETERLFKAWGWDGNVTRSYDGTGASSGITSVYVSIHRFDSASNAANALNYSLDDQVASTGAWEVKVVPIAGTTRALATTSDVTIYAQQGDIMIRLTVASPSGDPMPMAESILEVILNRIQ